MIYFNAGPQLLRYVVPRGSIAVDGVSLTVAAVERSRFSVSLVPHTAAETTLGRKQPGDMVNLETDLIGKYVEKLLQPYTPGREEMPEKITAAYLREKGFN